jgi:predicted metalloprotease
VKDRRDEGGSGGLAGFTWIRGGIIVFVLSLFFIAFFFAGRRWGGWTPTAVTPRDRGAGSEANREQDVSEKPVIQFVTFVLNDTQATWTKISAS